MGIIRKAATKIFGTTLRKGSHAKVKKILRSGSGANSQLGRYIKKVRIYDAAHARTNLKIGLAVGAGGAASIAGAAAIGKRRRKKK